MQKLARQITNLQVKILILSKSTNKNFIILHFVAELFSFDDCEKLYMK
jgi:hypothetical protein